MANIIADISIIAQYHYACYCAKRKIIHLLSIFYKIILAYYNNVLYIAAKLETMTTLLTKDVRRETIIPARIAGREMTRPMIVTMHPGDTISFREKGKRTIYEVSLHSCATLALVNYIQAKHKKDMDTYKVKRKNGCLRLRKPKVPNFSVFGKSFQLALK